MVFRFNIVSLIGEVFIFNTEMIPFMLISAKYVCRNKCVTAVYNKIYMVLFSVLERSQAKCIQCAMSCKKRYGSISNLQYLLFIRGHPQMYDFFPTTPPPPYDIDMVMYLLC